MTQAAANLPVISMSLLDKGGADADEFPVALRTATHDLDYFYLVGRRIPGEVISEAFAQATRFFALPLEDKQQVEMLNSARFRCYTRTGGELIGDQVDWSKQFDIGSDSARSHGRDAPACIRLEGPNLWPVAQPRSARLLHRLGAAVRRCRKTAHAVLGLGALGSLAEALILRPTERVLDHGLNQVATPTSAPTHAVTQVTSGGFFCGRAESRRARGLSFRCKRERSSGSSQAGSAWASSRQRRLKRSTPCRNQ